MKTFLALLLSASNLLAGHASTPVYEWLACNTAGKQVPTTFVPGDLGTLPIPTGKARPPYVAFFTTQVETSILGELTGKTITATFHVTGAPIWTVGFGPGPAAVRLYFTTVPGFYNLNDANSHPEDYWWANTATVTMDTTDNSTVTLTASLTPDQWQDALGCPATTCLSGFNAAVTNVAQIGFSFGGHDSWDTGIHASTAATFPCRTEAMTMRGYRSADALRSTSC